MLWFTKESRLDEWKIELEFRISWAFAYWKHFKEFWFLHQIFFKLWGNEIRFRHCKVEVITGEVKELANEIRISEENVKSLLLISKEE